MQLDAKNFVLFEGIVQRHRKVPPELRQMDPGGFGVRFLYPGEVVADIVNKDTTTFELHYATVDLLRAAYERELRMGGAFIFTDKPLRIQDKVVLALCIDYAGATVEQEATVVHITLPQGTNRAGVSVMFNDKKSLEASLKPYMELKALPEKQRRLRRRRGGARPTGRRSATGAPRSPPRWRSTRSAPPPLSPSASSTSLLLSLMIAAGPRPPTARCAAAGPIAQRPVRQGHVPEAAVRQLQLHPALGPVAVARLEGGLGGVDVGDVRRVRVEVEVRVDGHLLGGHRREEAREVRVRLEQQRLVGRGDDESWILHEARGVEGRAAWIESMALR